MERIIYGVSDFVAYINQTIEFAYPVVEIEGELSNIKTSQDKWVYFDIKDAEASVRCFGMMYMLPGPLEDGMRVRIVGAPKLHPRFGFSINCQSVHLLGEGALRKAAELLAAKLDKEGLFDQARKRPLPHPPKRIALITAGTSAAYADFIKIAKERWVGLTIDFYNVLVQGDASAEQVVSAVETANKQAEVADVVVVIRGGGSAEDLASFNDERVVRAVAVSRIPTLVAIGHEIDVSLAELAADVRASTPSNAAELLLPDKKRELQDLSTMSRQLDQLAQGVITAKKRQIVHTAMLLDEGLRQCYSRAAAKLAALNNILTALDPERPLALGYALVLQGGRVLRSVEQLAPQQLFQVKLSDGNIESQVKSIERKIPKITEE
ncbi:exodeoxyribonuclease VII large subunit [Candidatus Saccharibacteria bacterium]|nr:exodeoxyribonuclease VII large subunit [Candidatus Saccharibacteria bacterium]